MLQSNGIRRSFGAVQHFHFSASFGTRRSLHYDGRNRLSAFWTPTQYRKAADSTLEDGHDLLVRAGFLRQAHSGIFHLLPLGLRVQDKIERLIDRQMQSLGASKVALSSLSSEDLWQRSGRLDKGRGSEFFRLEDRKGAKLLLSPTHEEEITTIAANALHSHKQLPLRLYQIGRKYRDEARPRQGLLRGREFVMKDLYTFDVTDDAARQTYEDVRKAYCVFLDELRLPYLVANADSGNMGGSLSHEYHFASDSGEDTIIKCDHCDYSINEELYIGRPKPNEATIPDHIPTASDFVSKDRRTLLVAFHPDGDSTNIRVIKALFPDVDAGVENPRETWNSVGSAGEKRAVCLVDPRCLANTDRIKEAQRKDSGWEILEAKLDGEPILLTTARRGDACPSCQTGTLDLHKAAEIGHTFHLGTRYSEPLNLRVTDSNNKPVAVSMGCHGIGVSRLIGAAASLLSDSKGLNWPLVIAPFSVLLVCTPQVPSEDAHTIYDSLQTAGLEAAIDDREHQAFGSKLKDADLIGYPFIVVLGKAWAERKAVELQCRTLGVKEEVQAEALVGKISEYSERL